MKIKRKMFAELRLLMICLGTINAMAQSTIFNTPTTDTVAPKSIYMEFDFLAQSPPNDYSKIYLYNYRLVVGMARALEFGINFPIYNEPTSRGSSSNASIQPNIKWKCYHHDPAGISIALGGILNTPAINRHQQDSWGMLYALVSKRFTSRAYGPRLHAGSYKIVSANQDLEKGPISFLGARTGAILGYEQPMAKNISLVADWFSGNNSIGYFTPGISIAVPYQGLINAGYSIGNDTWSSRSSVRNRYFFIYYGKTF